METAGPRWVALGRSVIDRRVQLGMRTRAALAEATGLTTKTLGEIERGNRSSYDPATLALVEQTLRWPVGHIQQILNSPAAAGESDQGADLIAHNADGTATFVQLKRPQANDGRARPVGSLVDALTEVLGDAPLPPPELLWQLGLAPAPEPAPGEFTLAEILRLIHRDDFVLGVLLSRAGLGQTQMRRLVMAVRRRREEQSVELLREVADLIRDAGGVAPDPVWPPAWLVGEAPTADG